MHVPWTSLAQYHYIYFVNIVPPNQLSFEVPHENLISVHWSCMLRERRSRKWGRLERIYNTSIRLSCLICYTVVYAIHAYWIHRSSVVLIYFNCWIVNFRRYLINSLYNLILWIGYPALNVFIIFLSASHSCWFPNCTWIYTECMSSATIE